DRAENNPPHRARWAVSTAATCRASANARSLLRSLLTAIIRAHRPRQRRSAPIPRQDLRMDHKKTVNQAWGGRFGEATDAFVARFTASVGFDRRLYREDIRG